MYIIIFIATILIVNELIIIGVYGRPIKDTILSKFMVSHFHKYTACGRIIDANYKENLPFMSETPPSFFFKWQIYGHGVIPRWSRWTKELNYLARIPPKKEKTLEDY